MRRKRESVDWASNVIEKKKRNAIVLNGHLLRVGKRIE